MNFSIAFFFCKGGPQPLTWATRIKVAIGAIGDLLFSHEAEHPVIDRGFKASNKLLNGLCLELWSLVCYGVLLKK